MQKMTSDSTDPEESCVRSNNPGAAAHFTTTWLIHQLRD